MERNNSLKALKAQITKNKKHDDDVLLEYQICVNTNKERTKIFTQEELKKLYSRDGMDRQWFMTKSGATKTTHLYNHNGHEFKYIVIKRFQVNGYIDEHADNPTEYQTGNQLIDEINFWELFKDKKEGDYLCPMIKHFTSKSDKVHPCSEKAQDNVIIISQKAVYVKDLQRCFDRAVELNEKNGCYQTWDYTERLEAMEQFSAELGWRDAIYNSGNSGVIYDYFEECYKPVFIDYALQKDGKSRLFFMLFLLCILYKNH